MDSWFSNRRVADKTLDNGFFDRAAREVAEDLLGCLLIYRDAGGQIVETEAYHRDDPASHSFRGPTPRNGVMFGAPGHAYVYRSYGIHWCLNFVCEPGSAVLIRALEPSVNVEAMRARRNGLPDRLLCSGPGRLCAALDISIADNGASLSAEPFAIFPPEARPAVIVGPRIGISKAVDEPLRFGVEGSPYLSRKF